MNKTINYKYKDNLYQLNVSTPYSSMLHLAVNNVVCSCVSQSDFIINPDSLINRAIERYLIEKEFELI